MVILAKQAFCGRDEEESSLSCGNFREVFKLVTKHDSEIENH